MSKILPDDNRLAIACDGGWHTMADRLPITLCEDKADLAPRIRRWWGSQTRQLAFLVVPTFS
jgi:hypothetical protein